jgi:hypothetical protein
MPSTYIRYPTWIAPYPHGALPATQTVARMKKTILHRRPIQRRRAATEAPALGLWARSERRR